MDIRCKENKLFNEWKRKYDSFVIDGAPHPSVFLASPVKTVIVLKDINAADQRNGFDLRSQMEFEPHQWWRVVANWCAALTRFRDVISWSEIQSIPTKQCLEPFAFVQLKKSAGGSSVSEKVLREYAFRDADEIRMQLSIYRPRVIVCAGVGQILAEVLNPAGQWAHTERGIWFMELALYGNQRTYLINYMHPSARAMRSVVCYGLLDAYREIVVAAEAKPNSALQATCENAGA